MYFLSAYHKTEIETMSTIAQKRMCVNQTRHEKKAVKDQTADKKLFSPEGGENSPFRK